ncbi:S8 family serine peptidase [Chiayiivirga flava]|uniref:Subtilisin-like proprotein convertase family protein n=1 Tax=Chiayiivirga flava TaxID=659595 RepID=A0A7W8D6P8_9GAMM|nr:S8 family serine peptidase [Chiayiivirga flava]MBB5208924.1 subtilisin-like proprotein convertase family protein [Chiayiivirga flava]
MKRSGFGGTPLALALAVFLLPIGLSAAPTRLSTHAPAAVAKPTAEPAVRGLPTVWHGDHYSVKGVRYDLVRRADQVVVQLRPDAPSQTVEELTRAGGALDGFVPEGRLRAGLTVFGNASLASMASQSPARAYDSVSQAMSRLAAEPAVAWSAPVFVNTTFGSYAVATDELLVRLRPGVSEQAFFADARFAGAQRAASSDAFVVRASAGAGTAVLALAGELQNDPRILWAEPNFFQERKRQFTPDDPLFADQWHLDNTGQGGGTPGADAHLEEAWDLVPSGASDVVIAIVDDGPDMDHPDLSVFQNPGEIAANGIDDDGNGYVDDTIGWDFTSGGLGDNNPGATTPTDYHSTPVAGVAAARGNNAQGVTGAAFGARIFASRIFGDDGNATDDANIGSALAYAAGRGRMPGDNPWHGADITNNSWGGGAPATAIEDALQWAADNGRDGLGTSNFFATGNAGVDAVSYPASLSPTMPSVIAIGASNNQDERSSYSQYGPEIDLVAPSNGGTLGITTTDRLGADGLNGLPDLDYTDSFGGTSSATPLAAGVGALLLGADPTLTVSDIRALLRGTADKIGALPYTNGFNVEYGYGRINAAAAVAAIGSAQIRVFHEGEEVQHSIELPLTAVAGDTLPITFSVVSAGSETLTLGGLALAGAPEFALEQPLGDTALELGESTAFSIGFLAGQAGSYDTVVTLQSNDPQTPAFSIPIHVDVQPVSIGGHVFEDWNGNGIEDAGDPARVGATVYLDLNGNGTLEGSTQQGIDSGGPLGLGFGQAPVQVTHTLQVAGIDVPLDRVTVTLDVTHSWIGDTVVRLIGPNGQAIVLADQPGGPLNDADDYPGSTFDDDASLPINGAAPPYTLTYRPVEPLATFAGIDPNGDWTLEITDMFPAEDDGTLNQWSLTLFTGAEPITVTDDAGDYRFLNLAPDTYHVAVDAPGWTVTEPFGGSHEVQVVGSENNVGFDFGQVRQHAIYGRVYDDANANGTAEPDEAPVADAAVFLDGNSDGVIADPVAASYTQAPGLAIPDADPFGVFDMMAVDEPFPVGALVDLRVEIDITHTYVGDLVVFLGAPDGRIVQLTANNGGGGNDFSGTVFDDDAAASITEVSEFDAPFTGEFRPVEPLSTLNGVNVNGLWTLFVGDLYGFDVGTLDSWTLEMEYRPEPQATSNTFGNYRFDVVPGVYDVRLIVPDGLAVTQPVSGNYLVPIAQDGVAVNRDFGLGTANLAPVATSLPDVTLPVGAVADIATAQGFSDPDGDTLTYSADGLPGVLVIDPATGVISGPVSEADLGEHVITVTATDVHGASVALDFTLRVAAAPIFADGFED